MARFQFLNVEPSKTKKNDCVTRAITFASGLSYPTVRKKLFHTSRLLDCESTYCPTCYGFLIQEVLGGVPKNCDGMTVGEFADLHPNGTYLIRISGHLLCVQDNCVYDLWDNRHRLCDLAWKMPNN